MRLSRRQLLQAGVAGSLVLAGGGWLAASRKTLPRPGGLRFLTADEAAVVSVLAPVLLGIPEVPRAAVVAGVDAAVLSLPRPVQAEVRELFDVLAHPLGRRWLAGLRDDWREATPQALSGFLGRWQTSRLALLRSGFQALHSLIGAAWYGQPASWEAIGYRQPQHVMERLP